MSSEKQQQYTNHRNIATVIIQILEIVPKSETVIINELEKYSKELCYKSPESLTTSDYWMPVATILCNRITEFDCDWKKQVHLIFIGY
jgi:hypothetical protein